MRIYLNDTQHWYQIQNVCRLFYPGTDIELIEDETQADLCCYVKTDETVTVKACHAQSGRTLEDTVLFLDKPIKRDIGLALGRLVYDLLKDHTGICPQWGTLTGVRPVHLVQRYLDSGLSEEQVHDLFCGTYRVSEEKYALAYKTTQVQSRCVQKQNIKDISLYISIPFCPSRCVYCSFVSHDIHKSHKLIQPYFDLLIKEINATFDLIDQLGLNLRTVYVGGGTPTTLTAPQLDILFGTVFSRVKTPLEECTIEAGRPDTIDREKLLVIKKYPVTRININPQTLNDEVLKKVGRLHTGDDVVNTFKLAREIGFDNINMDLIAGLPGEDYDSFVNSLDRVIALGPENVTVHTLSVKRSSNLKNEDPDAYQAQNRMVEDMQTYVGRALSAAGYDPYYLYRQKNTLSNLENVGFTKPGFEGLYNIYMMEEMHTILGCGAGSVTKLVNPNSTDIQRIYNFKYPTEYINSFDEMIARKEGVREYYAKVSEE